MRPLLKLSAIAAISLSLAGCAIIIAPGDDDVRIHTLFSKDAVVGNGALSAEARPVATLQELELVGPVTMDVRVGPAASLRVEADSNLLPMVRTDTVGGALKVWVDGNVRSNHGIRVTYTVPQLSQVRTTGSGRLSVSELNGGALTVLATGSGNTQLAGRVGNLNVELNGSGNVNADALQNGNANVTLRGSGRVSLGQVNAEALNLKLRGSGELQAIGMATHLNAQVQGSGGASLAGLASQRADLSTTGSGDITARVNDSLVAHSTGSGRITVHGNPAQRNVSGKNVYVVN